eukprot:2569950-Pyramimonas_sp.AAC.1
MSKLILGPRGHGHWPPSTWCYHREGVEQSKWQRREAGKGQRGKTEAAGHESGSLCSPILAHGLNHLLVVRARGPIGCLLYTSDAADDTPC